MNKTSKNAKQAPSLATMLANLDKIWLIVAAAAIVVVVAVTIGLIRYYGEPDTTGAVVARVGNTRIRMGDVDNHEILEEVHHRLMWEYIEMFPDDMEFNYDHIFRDGMTFGQVVREEAARLAAVYREIEEFALNELNSDLSRVQMREDLIMVAAHDALEIPEMAARFEAFLPESAEEAEARAMAILNRIQAGEDFEQLRLEYCDDGAPAEGYTFPSGAMVPEFEEGTRALEIGEISGLVQSQFGFHIIQRIEPNLDNEDLQEMIDNHAEAIEELRAEIEAAGDDADEEDIQLLYEMEQWDPILGAQHILIMARMDATPLTDMMFAVFSYFDAYVEATGVTFTRALDNLPLE